MKRLILMTMGGLAAIAGSEMVVAEKKDDGFVSIFDGKTLKGWEEMPSGKKKAWSVVEGIIVGEGDKGRGYLVFENKDLANFELKLCYRFPGKGNSGISIRARKDPTGKRSFQSYHADLGHLGIGGQVMGAWDFHTPGRKEHRCFRGDRLEISKDDKPTITPLQGALTAADIKKGDWNEVHLIIQDNTFEFFVNGKPASEFTEHLDSAKRLHRGMIQLQLHDPGMIVHYKDLMLKILK